MKSLTLKLIAGAQKLLLRSERPLALKLYMKLARLHFKQTFNSDLEEEVLNNTILSDAACRRHARLVVKVLYKDAPAGTKRMVRAAAKGSFRKNILLATEI